MAWILLLVIVRHSKWHLRYHESKWLAIQFVFEVLFVLTSTSTPLLCLPSTLLSVVFIVELFLSLRCSTVLPFVLELCAGVRQSTQATSWQERLREAKRRQSSYWKHPDWCNLTGWLPKVKSKPRQHSIRSWIEYLCEQYFVLQEQNSVSIQ